MRLLKSDNLKFLDTRKSILFKQVDPFILNATLMSIVFYNILIFNDLPLLIREAINEDLLYDFIEGKNIYIKEIG